MAIIIERHQLGGMNDGLKESSMANQLSPIYSNASILQKCKQKRTATRLRKQQFTHARMHTHTHTYLLLLPWVWNVQ
jgi:hypothetical protein